MGKLQKVSTKEFKEEAVRLVPTSGKPIAQIARDASVSLTVRFMGGARNEPNMGMKHFQERGIKLRYKRENRRLKREVERLQQERDILKKAVSIFSRESK
jgi:transposase